MKLMRVRITLGRIVALVVLCALASIALTIAFAHGDSSKSKRKAKVTAPPTKTVPGVVNQPYVFAESTLQQQGFGWKVVGPVAGWASAVVSSQSPAQGTKVMDTGAPLVTLQLSKPKGLVTQGTPENSSPYAGTKIMLPAGSTGTTQSTTSAQTTTTGAFSTSTTTTRSMSTSTNTTPAQVEKRPPAFKIAGAKPEPLDEILADYDTWRNEKPRELCRKVVIELLAWQFASPVRWIETQDLLFIEEAAGGLGVERFVEIGVKSAPTVSVFRLCRKFPSGSGVLPLTSWAKPTSGETLIPAKALL